MCRRVTCSTCGKATWAGCGHHVDQVLRNVPAADRCTCPPEDEATGGDGFFTRLFRR